MNIFIHTYSFVHSKKIFSGKSGVVGFTLYSSLNVRGVVPPNDLESGNRGLVKPDETS